MNKIGSILNSRKIYIYMQIIRIFKSASNSYSLLLPTAAATNYH